MAMNWCLKDVSHRHGINKEEEVEPVAQEAFVFIAERNYIQLNYWTINNRNENLGVLWPYDAILNLLARSNERVIRIDSAQSHAHFDHIEQIISVCNEKAIRIIACHDDPTVIERQIRMVVDRSLDIEKNAIEFRYDKGGYSMSDESELLDLENRWSRLSIVMLTEGETPNIVYNHLLESIRFLRNRNLLIDIHLESEEPGFEKLFTDLGWNYDEGMVVWNNGSGHPRDILRTFEGDNNEYCLTSYMTPEAESIEEELNRSRVDTDLGYISDNSF